MLLFLHECLMHSCFSPWMVANVLSMAKTEVRPLVKYVQFQCKSGRGSNSEFVFQGLPACRGGARTLF